MATVEQSNVWVEYLSNVDHFCKYNIESSRICKNAAAFTSEETAEGLVSKTYGLRQCGFHPAFGPFGPGEISGCRLVRFPGMRSTLSIVWYETLVGHY